MAETQNNFKCVIISPAGKLLDCQASSVVFVAHDGSVGILHNHLPMLCSLGVGFMEITSESENKNANENGGNHKRVLIDRGFALISSNLVNIIANDAVCTWNTSREKIEHLLEKSTKKIDTAGLTSHQKWLENKKVALLKEILTTVK
jgi:F0F1-type ATP synthase epsilon subunit